MSESNALDVFRFEGDKPFRVIKDEKGDPWFVAVDVCRALALENPTKAIERVDEEDRGLTLIQGNPNQVNIVNESGLYALILTSRKPDAKRFKRWVTSEVLPSIRKTGKYEMSKGNEQSSRPSRQGSALNADPRVLAAQLRVIADSVEQLMASALPTPFIDKELAALLEEDNRELADRMSRVEAKVEAMTKGENYFTVVAWYKYKNLGPIKLEDAQKLGRQATKLSEEKGIPVGETRHPLYGDVNTYHESILTAITGG